MVKYSTIISEDKVIISDIKYIEIMVLTVEKANGYIKTFKYLEKIVVN